MPLLLRIAMRNLIEHLGKTLIIGLLVGLGVVVLIVGNSLMDTARAGIERAFIDNYTGDIMISGTADGPVSLFGVQSVGGIDPTPILPDFSRIAEHVDDHPHITSWTVQITGFGFLRPNDERVDGFRNSALTVLFATDPETYTRTFSNVRILDGRHLRPGEIGLMLSAERVDELEKNTIRALADQEIELDSYPVRVGDEVRIVGLTSSGLPRIRVVPLVGIYETVGISEGVGFELVSYVDVQTLRAILGLNLGASAEVVLTDAEVELLDASGTGVFDVDTLFSDDFFAETGDEGEIDFDDFDRMFRAPRGAAADAGDPAIADADAQAVVPTPDEPPDGRVSGLTASVGQTWNYILARVDSPRRVEGVVRELNQWMASEGIDAQAGNWEVAAGPFATTADVIRTVFNVAIIVVGVVAVIIMMNTLVISVMERTSEIGTMRALGAQRAFVWRLFLWETLTITTVFGLLGVAVALGIIGILNLIGIPATNTFLTVLFAGPQLKPVASAVSAIGSLLIVSFVGLVAHIYPVTVALRIEPIRAIQTE